jgi:uncharacterized protein (DUF362 family)
MDEAIRRGALLALALLLGGCREDAPKQEAVASASAVAPKPAPSAPASADVVSEASEEAPGVDAGPSVMATGMVDGAALRKRHVARLKKDTSPVTVLRGKSPLELGEAICQAVVPKVRWDTPVLLKPNLCGFDGLRDPAKTKGDDGLVGRTTHVDFTRGVVRCLKKRGFKKITIAEGCGISHAFWQKVIAQNGYEAMAKEEHVPLVALDDDGVFDVEGDEPGEPLAISGIGKSHVPTLLMPKILAEHLDHGLFISLPKIKAHRYSVTSMAIKGMQGTVMRSDARPAYKQKYRMHAELNALIKEHKAAHKAAKESDAAPPPMDPMARRRAYVASLRAFGERMVDVLELETPDVVLADGAPAMGGDGFWKLYPTEELVAVGGTNPVLVDRVGAEILGLWKNARLKSELLGFDTSPLIRIAEKRFGLDLDATQVTGNGADLIGKPRATHYVSMDRFSVQSDSTPPWSPVSLSVSTETPVAHVASTATPVAHAAALGSDAVALDGRADDAVWSRAPVTQWSTDWSGASTKTRTRARFAWSADALYVLFELDGAGLFVDHTRPVEKEREALFREDCVELFLGHDADNPRHYLEIEFGPFGHFYDLEVVLGKKHDTDWSSGLTVKTTQDAAHHRAVIEARLSAPEIVKALKKGAKLPLGLYRMEGKAPRQYLAWSPTRTKKPNFHVPTAFGRLVLD